MRLIVRAPGVTPAEQDLVLAISDDADDLTISALKELVHKQHPLHVDPPSQRLIYGSRVIDEDGATSVLTTLRRVRYQPTRALLWCIQRIAPN